MLRLSLLFKTRTEKTKITIGQLVFYQIYQKHMENVSNNESINTLTLIYENFNVAVHNHCL